MERERGAWVIQSGPCVLLYKFGVYVTGIERPAKEVSRMTVVVVRE